MNFINKLFITLLFIGNITYGQEWIKTDITNFASINFPVASELTENLGETVYTANDEFAFYIVSIRKLTDQQSSQITKDEIPNLYKGVANGTMAAIKAEIVSMNEISLYGIPVLDLEYYAPANPQLPSKRFKRILYINQNIISIDFWALTSQESIINKRKSDFFNSFLIHSNKVKNNKNSKVNIASETGYLAGQIFFYLILIAFLIGLFLLIRYFIKKNKSENYTKKSIEQPHSVNTRITCKKCESENFLNAKYCMRCGFELPKN